MFSNATVDHLLLTIMKLRLSFNISLRLRLMLMFNISKTTVSVTVNTCINFLYFQLIKKLIRGQGTDDKLTLTSVQLDQQSWQEEFPETSAVTSNLWYVSISALLKSGVIWWPSSSVVQQHMPENFGRLFGAA